MTKYEKKLKIEAMIFSLIIGLMMGFLAGFSVSVILYFFKTSNLLAIILVTILSFIVTTILIYLFKKPTPKHAAQRIDALGLEERVITMMELEDKDSEMIKLQRVDAKAKLKTIEVKHLKFKSFTKGIISLCLVMFISVLGIILLNQRVYAKYQKTYTITFDSNGGTVVDSQTVVGGSKINAPKNPKKEGFDFYYWYEKNINDPFNFDVLVEKDYTLTARWEVKSDEDKIIEALIKQLRDIVDRANVSDSLKQDLHLYIDALEENIHREDTLPLKIAKIEEARKYILQRIKEEIEQQHIIKIGEALKQFESTYNLGEAILLRNKPKIDQAINTLVEDLLAIDEKELRVELLLKTADDIEAALELSNEENPKLRKTLKDLADYLRYLAREIIEGDLPEDSLVNEFIQEMEATKEAIKDALDLSDEEQLKEDINEAIQDAIDELTDPLETDQDKEQKQESDGGASEEQGEDGTPIPEELIPVIIDGNTKYIEYLESLKAQAILKLQDKTLTKEQIDALNKYINNIDMQLEGINENGN